MKLNIDCMRDVLLILEEAPYRTAVEFTEICAKLVPDYTHDEICYSILKLDEAGFISAKIERNLNSLNVNEVSDITYEGHQFLANVRTNKVWSTTKDVMSKVGSTSVQTASQIASTVISELIKNTLFPI